MKKQERLQMLVAAVATLWWLPVFDFLLPEDRQRLQCGGMLVSSFDHVFAYIIFQRPPFLYPVPPLLALFWHNWHLPTTQWGYLRYLYVSSYFYAFWCFKLILKLMSLGLGTTSIFGIGLPVPGTSSYPMEIPTKPLKICALWSKWETARPTW